MDSRAPFFPLSERSSPAATPRIIGPLPGPRELREWPLVLSSMGIPCSVRPDEGSWFIIVSSDGDFDRAVAAIRQYQAENRDWPPRPVKEALPYPRSLVAPLILLGLVIFHVVTGPSQAGSVWFARGTASSALICHGQLWRAVTALTLHADMLHVAGNALSGSLFLSAVNRRLGDGRGSFLVLLSGTLGNVANALWHRGDHLSIGASTAIFGAVGILMATQLAIDRKAKPPSLVVRAAPLVGGAALLGMLGASPHSDLLAHLFGLLAGLGIGLVSLLVIKSSRPSRAYVQWLAAACGLLVVLGAWVAAYLVHGRA